MRIVAFDTETEGLDWFDGQKVFLTTWATNDGTTGIARLDDGVEEFYDVVASSDVVVGHNLPFDVHFVRETFGFDIMKLPVAIADTNILARLVYPAGQGSWDNFKLKNLATKYLADDAADGQDAIKAFAKEAGISLTADGGFRKVWELGGAAREAMEYYAVKDAKLTLDLYEHMIAQVEQPSALWSLFELEMKVMRVLIEAERTGIKLDQAKVRELEEQYTSQSGILRCRIEDTLGVEALGGPGSDQALREALLGIGVPLYRKTKSGEELSTAQFALQEFENDFPILKDFLELRTVNKFLSTYIGAIDGRDVVHTSFHQCDAWTGRMSSSRPNMQNFPARSGTELREVFVPREGHSFVVADYDSIEVRLLAYYLNDQGFIDLIEGGHDPHAWMASNIYGGSPSDYVKGSSGEKQRSISKNVLFAITYGAGGGRVQDMLIAAGEQVDGTHEARRKPPWCECSGCRLAYQIRCELPGFWDLSRRIKGKVANDGYVTTLMGRRQKVAKDKGYVGLNALIQGSAADVMKQGLVNVATAFIGKPLLVVHDEVVVEVPTENANEALHSTIKSMEYATSIRPGLKVTGKIVHNNYGEAK